MLRYKTETRPGLVALYGIRPGNGAGQFLQPRSQPAPGNKLEKFCVCISTLEIWPTR